MVQNPPCWRASYALGQPKQRKCKFVLMKSLCSGCPSGQLALQHGGFCTIYANIIFTSFLPIKVGVPVEVFFVDFLDVDRPGPAFFRPTSQATKGSNGLAWKNAVILDCLVDDKCRCHSLKERQSRLIQVLITNSVPVMSNQERILSWSNQLDHQDNIFPFSSTVNRFNAPTWGRGTRRNSRQGVAPLPPNVDQISDQNISFATALLRSGT